MNDPLCITAPVYQDHFHADVDDKRSLILAKHSSKKFVLVTANRLKNGTL